MPVAKPPPPPPPKPPPKAPQPHAPLIAAAIAPPPPGLDCTAPSESAESWIEMTAASVASWCACVSSPSACGVIQPISTPLPSRAVARAATSSAVRLVASGFELRKGSRCS